MLDKKYYTTGQVIHELIGDRLTYFFKNGKLKAEGLFVKGQMEGEWIFIEKQDSVGKLETSKKVKRTVLGYVMTKTIK